MITTKKNRPPLPNANGKPRIKREQTAAEPAWQTCTVCGRQYLADLPGKCAICDGPGTGRSRAEELLPTKTCAHPGCNEIIGAELEYCAAHCPHWLHDLTRRQKSKPNGCSPVPASPSPQPPVPSPSPRYNVKPAGHRAHDPDARSPSHRGRRRPAQWINEQSATHRLVIDPEFERACRPLSDDERQRLSADIQRNGCLQPLIAWWDDQAKKLILVDGHHRWQICQQLDTWVEILALPFGDRAEALAWITEHQLGRRNLSPAERDEQLARAYARELEQRAEARGRRSEKTNGRSPVSSPAPSPQPRDPALGKAADKVAEDLDVSPATVKRAVQSENARVKIASASGRSLGELRALSRREVAELAARDAAAIARELACGIEHWRLGKERAQLETSAPANGKSKSTGASSLSPAELKCEKRGTVRVPFQKSHRCKASITLYERSDGRWFYVCDWRNAKGGGYSNGIETATYNYPNGEKGRPKKGHPDRAACLQAAAEELQSAADQQGFRYWPAAARQVLRKWRESLAPAAEQRIPAPLRKRVVADSDAAVRVIESHLAEYGARAEYEQSEHLLDAINAWRGQRKPFGSSANPKRRKPR